MFPKLFKKIVSVFFFPNFDIYKETIAESIPPLKADIYGMSLGVLSARDSDKILLKVSKIFFSFGFLEKKSNHF